VQRSADRHVVAQHRLFGAKIGQRHLVALRDMFAQCHAGRQHRALRQAAVIGDDRDIVALMHADGARIKRYRACDLVHRGRLFVRSVVG
jgi:hypothetical protein